MRAKGPAEPPGDRGEPGAVVAKAAGVIVADALDAADHDFVALLDPGKPHPPVKRQIFLGRVDDLQQMAL